MQSNVKAQLKELDKLIAVSQKFDKKKHDYTGDPSALVAANTGKFAINEQEMFMGRQAFTQHKGFTLESNALAQLLNRVSVPFFGKGNGTTMDRADWETMMKKYPKYFAAIMNDLLPQVQSKGLIVRTHEKNIRAVLTDRYGIVDNTAALQAIRSVLGQTAGSLKDLRIANSTLDRDRLDLRVVFAQPQRQNPNDAD